MRFLLLVIGWLPFALKAQIQEPICHLPDSAALPRAHNCDFEKLQLAVSFEPKAGKVFGTARYFFQPIQPVIDSVFLDAPGITIKKVQLANSGAGVRFQQTATGVSIYFTTQKPIWKKSYQLEIEYEAQPRKGLYFIGWNDPRNLSRKQIWTQGQGVDNRYWFPCYDDVNDKLITETTISFDSNFTVVSNGKLLETHTNANGTKTWHYAMDQPHAPYLVMLAIDKYAYKDVKAANGIVSRQYYYADHPETYDATYAHSAEMMDFLVKETGVAYPWKTYANCPVQDFMYGAMENTTATIYGDFYLLDGRAAMERSYTATNAHELTHQWFGDYITEWNAAHHWLHESFATYYSKMFMRKINGEAFYETACRGEANAALAADRNDNYPVAHSKAGTNRHYSKGSHVIDMLRYVVGDAVFRDCITYYLKRHPYENVVTHDLQRAFMEHAGIDLTWFFEEWILHSGAPRYRVHIKQDADATAFLVSQSVYGDTLNPIFQMPVIFEVYYSDGTRDSVRTWISHIEDTVIVKKSAGKKVAFALFDPASRIIKSIDFAKPMEVLINQASHAPHMIDRYDALAAMRDSALELKQEAFSKIFFTEKEFGVKSEIVRQLRNDSSAASLSIFKSALADSAFLLRREVIDDLPRIPKSILPLAENLLSDSSYYTIERTLQRLTEQYPENRSRYLMMTKEVIGISKNVRIARLELLAKEDSAAGNELVNYTSVSYEFRTRLKAMEALERLHLSHPQLAANLFDAMLNPNGRLARPATKTFQIFMKDKVFHEQAKALYETGNWKSWEKEILDKVM
ncbi:MAG: M1 family aminopeptidase [Chitinophagales bacterium]